MEQKEHFKIFKNTNEKSFSESVLYSKWSDSPKAVSGMLMRNPEIYKLVTSPEYTHIYLAPYIDLKDAVWVIILFNENAGRTLLQTLPVS